MNEGHGEQWYFCTELCDSLAGDPGEWPIGFPHKENPGVVRYHHSRCVTVRLDLLSRLIK